MNKEKNGAIPQSIKWSTDTEYIKKNNYQIHALGLILILY